MRSWGVFILGGGGGLRCPVAGPAGVDGVAGLFGGDVAGLAGAGSLSALAAPEGGGGADDGLFFGGVGGGVFHNLILVIRIVRIGRAYALVTVCVEGHAYTGGGRVWRWVRPIARMS